jgi:hypothetical protein
VNNATARLLKAITAAELATLREGNTVYVMSLRNYWKWLPTSTLTSDDITISAPTVVGVGAGRFERLTGNESPDWKLQTTWFIDSTAPNQEASGLTALTPLQSDVELTRRWGADGAIQIGTQVTITYAQAPTTVSNFDVRILDNASVTWLGTPTVNKSGIVLTAVTVQVRTPGAEVPWAITGPTLGAVDVGKLAIITASGTGANVGAYARVLKDNGGGSVRVSPFGSATVAGAFTQATPLVGDTISIVTPMTLRIGFFSLRNDTQLISVAAPTRNVFIFDSITLDGAVGAGVGIDSGIVRSENSQVLYMRSILQNLSLTGINSLSNIHRLLGGGCAVQVDIRSNQVIFRQVGVTGIINTYPTSFLTAQVDCYFQNAQLNLNQGACVNTQGVAFFDKAAADTCFTLGGGGGTGSGTCFVRQTGATADWGSGNAGHGLKIQSGSQYIYTTKPTINGTLGAGREALIGGTDKVYGAVPYVEGANNAMLVLNA